jgi:ribosomal protein S18 acetylase RimI-like enzyme
VGNTAWLKGIGENNFKTFWVKERLVGLYIVNGNYIDTIAVHPYHERKGYGSEILNYCIKDRVYENHFDELYLATYYQNRKAQRYYLKNGFDVRGFYCENTYKG